MYRLFYLMIGAILVFMLWRIIRIVARTGGFAGSKGGGEALRHDAPADESLRNAQDAKFEDLQPSPKDPPGRASSP